MELVVAMAVLGIIMSGLALSLSVDFKSVALVRSRQVAEAAANRRLEEFRDVDYAALALLSQPVQSTDSTNPDSFVSKDGLQYDVTGTGQKEGAPYWLGWDIARDVALLRDGTGGFVLDGFGGLHGFSIGNNPVPVASGAPYWLGWDIARGVTMLADGTGYIVDGFGGVHPFTTNATAPATTQLGPYWSGFDIAQGVSVMRDASEGIGGYVLDGYGGLSGFDIGANGAPNVPGPPIDGPYWPGWNIARGVVVNSE